MPGWNLHSCRSDTGSTCGLSEDGRVLTASVAGQQHAFSGRSLAVCTQQISRHQSRPGRRPATINRKLSRGGLSLKSTGLPPERTHCSTVGSGDAIQTIFRSASPFAGLWVVRAPASGRRPRWRHPHGTYPQHQDQVEYRSCDRRRFNRRSHQRGRTPSPPRSSRCSRASAGRRSKN